MSLGVTLLMQQKQRRHLSFFRFTDFQTVCPLFLLSSIQIKVRVGLWPSDTDGENRNTLRQTETL